jgi:hypothetical protein
MPLFPSTKFYFAFKWLSVIRIVISVAAIVTAIVSVTLSLTIFLVSITFLKILIFGVVKDGQIGLLTFIPLSHYL